MESKLGLISRFYSAFAHRDAAGMIACYHPNVTFHDPVFETLHGDHARGMWRMLCERAGDMTLTWGQIHVDGDHATAHWEARYRFSGTGRRVHNVISARFEFRDGLIWTHTDDFNLTRWARQALAPVGWFIGHSPKTHAKIRAMAAQNLNRFLSKPPA